MTIKRDVNNLTMAMSIVQTIGDNGSISQRG